MQTKAEGLAASLAFEAAIASVADMTAESHPEFASFVTWAASFIELTSKERDRVQAAAKQTLADARRHATACDYPAAIQAIETIAAPLRHEEAVALLKTCVEKRRESESLITAVGDRIKRKELDGLLPMVERAVALRADRSDLEKIRRQLLERCAERLSRARAVFVAGDARSAAAALGRALPEDYSGPDQEIINRIRRAVELEDDVIRLVREARADSTVTAEEAAAIVDAGEAYLAINPNNGKVKTLVAQSRAIAEPVLREKRMWRGVATNDDIVSHPPLVNSIGMKFKFLPAGTFTMGEAGAGSDEKQHQVTLTKPFYLGVYEVTNAQYKRVMGSVPSKWKDDGRPVEQVSWDEAADFCRRLSALAEEREAGRVYRLPTEAEWEYACRAGTTTRYSFGNDESVLGEYAWFDKNAGGKTHPVGQKKPNAWGLYDMHGNVWEWCSDWYVEYGSGAVTDPQGPSGPSGASGRVRRGGGWFSSAGYCRSAFRYGGDPSIRYISLGFRLALSPSGVEPPEAAK